MDTKIGNTGLDTYETDTTETETSETETKTTEIGKSVLDNQK
jgi:hypothetical protein